LAVDSIIKRWYISRHVTTNKRNNMLTTLLIAVTLSQTPQNFTPVSEFVIEQKSSNPDELTLEQIQDAEAHAKATLRLREGVVERASYAIAPPPWAFSTMPWLTYSDARRQNPFLCDDLKDPFDKDNK
jgi:hypothetical protein